MINASKIRILVLAVLITSGFADVVYALPTIGKSTRAEKQSLLKSAANCEPAKAVAFLDINNVRARVMTGGDMWWDQGTRLASYEVPKGSRKSALYAGSCWVAGIQNGSLKVAAQTFRQDGNDYWPGPLNFTDGSFEITKDQCNEWDRFWKVNRVVVEEFKQLMRSGNVTATQLERYRPIWEWPARGNGIGLTGSSVPLNNNSWSKAKGSTGQILEMDDREYAPFVDVGGAGNDPNLYNPELGDYPNMEDPGRGDQMIWWVFNDRGNTKQQTQSESIGLEVQTTAFAFTSKDFLNDATFYNYRVINRAGLTLDSAFMATWTDADLGYAFDDYIGCDTARGLGILYNALPQDGNGEVTSYGENPPMIGVDFFIGPQKYFTNPTTGEEDTVKLKMQAFTYFSNLQAGVPVDIQDPSTATEFYFYMTGSRKTGILFSYDFTGPGDNCTGIGSGDPVKFVFAGDVQSGWSECVCDNAPGDRRFIHSAGPFQLRPGDVNDVIIGVTWVPNAGTCPDGNFSKIRVADDLIQELFDNNFKAIEGPQAPRVVYREMDRKIIMYLQNDPNSTNYQEKFGYEIDSAKYRVRSSKAANAGFADSLYKFEGYRIFQLKNANITPSQVFDETGKLDENVAREVKQCDIKNGVGRIINWTKNIELEGCENCFTPVEKVNGSDSGIVHSFELTTDAFSESGDNRLVNYKTYYYLVVAYAHNNFKNFDANAPDTTQDRAYLESSKGHDGGELKVLAIMPNPSNGSMGTVLNADYGTGINIQKLEGVGNGGNDIQLTAESEEEALQEGMGYQAVQPVYRGGKTPIDIKVIDPQKVQSGEWTLYVLPDTTKTGPFATPGAEGTTGIIGTNAKWALVKDGMINEAIYSERNLDAINEQIIEDYGISISLNQTVLPGVDQTDFTQNGHITSDISFENPAFAWLAGIPDEEQQSRLNWIRSGGYTADNNPICYYDDEIAPYNFDSLQFYENMIINNAANAKTWAPVALTAYDRSSNCGFGVNPVFGYDSRTLGSLRSVDIVFTSDKSKWSKSLVLEMADDNNNIIVGPFLSEGNTPKFFVRSHRSWTGDVDNDGNPIYATSATDTGFSYFPGYAIDQETGERLNIIFGENSALRDYNGKDLIWNPTSDIFDMNGNAIFGGGHFVYVIDSKYDGCDSISKLIGSKNDNLQKPAYNQFMWVGMTISNGVVPLLPLKDGLIPTDTRVRLRVTRPFAYYAPPGIQLDQQYDVPGYPKYRFITDNLAPSKLTDADNPYVNEKQELLDIIQVVPNPYYAYNGYEKNRLDTRVKIVNLPPKSTVHIYSLDGSLIRKLTKDDDAPQLEWDIRNHKGLPIASGMYLIHVEAEGIGEKVIKWFGAMRPVDITNY